MTIVDTIFKALAPAIPDRVIAGHHADLLVAALHGINTEDVGVLHRQFRPARRRLGRQAGARTASPATVCINDGDTHNSPNEQAEAKFPLVVERYALVPDSGGAGRHRGGLGVERVVRARTPMTVNTQIDRAHCRPWGLDGGGDGDRQRGGAAHRRAMEDRFPQRQGAGGAAQAGRRLPHPLRRRRRLRHAVRAAGRPGRARTCARATSSVEAAAELYGVVLDPETLRGGHGGDRRSCALHGRQPKTPSRRKRFAVVVLVLSS